jgi:hypothetical protein
MNMNAKSWLVVILCCALNNLRTFVSMKCPICFTCFSLFLVVHSLGDELPDDVQALVAKRDEAISRIDITFVRELEKLKVKYTKLGDLDSANKIVELIAQYPTKVENGMPSDPEFDNTTWEFRNKSKQLGILDLLPGGKVKSKNYPNSTWKRVDKDTIRFEYESDKSADVIGGHVTFRFQGANRSTMSGVQSEAGTPRYLHKIIRE